MTTHPIFPAGINSDDYNGDEFDGAGTNWSILELLLDSFEGLQPVILTEALLEVFEDCPDLIFPCAENMMVAQRRIDTSYPVTTRNVFAPVPLSDTLRARGEQRVQRVRNSRPELVLGATKNTRTINRGVNTEQVGAALNVSKVKSTGRTLKLSGVDRIQRIVSSGRTLVTKTSGSGLAMKREVRTEHLRKWR